MKDIEKREKLEEKINRGKNLVNTRIQYIGEVYDMNSWGKNIIEKKGKNTYHFLGIYVPLRGDSY